jgi:hypothetical protein
MTLPPQGGKIVFEGRKAAQFWLRTLSLEKEIAAVQAMLAERPERKRGVVPIAAEYLVDEKFKFIYFIQVHVDTLGIQDGIGIVYWASPENEKNAYEVRDDYADDVLKRLGTRPFDEVLEIDVKKEE